jgi:hypothetical protein
MADTENGKLEYPRFLFVFSLFSNIVTDSSMNFAEFVENYDMQLLNSNITTEEVLKAAKSLKNGKAGGKDGILNEMLKISCIYNTTAYVNLFNTLLKSKFILESVNLFT